MGAPVYSAACFRADSCSRAVSVSGVFVRFCLTDRILALESGQSIQVAKNVSYAEEYLQDHFPGFPVLPGVLMVETMVQAGAWLLREATGFQYSTVLLKEAKGMKFANFLSPGQTLTVECRVHGAIGPETTLKCEGLIGELKCCSGRIVLRQFNLATADPRRAPQDERQIAALKQQFEQLWKPAPSPA